MNPLGHISKVLTSSLLAVMLFMNVCSAWCAMGSGCCNNQSRQKQQYRKSCCAHKEKENNTNADCQAMHLAFFNTTGQFFSDFSKDVQKPFQDVQEVITPVILFNLTEDHHRVVEYNGFHPPPPKAGIRILIRSFQI